MVTISLASCQFSQRTVFCELILNRHGCVCVCFTGGRQSIPVVSDEMTLVWLLLANARKEARTVDNRDFDMR